MFFCATHHAVSELILYLSYSNYLISNLDAISSFLIIELLIGCYSSSFKQINYIPTYNVHTALLWQKEASDESDVSCMYKSKIIVSVISTDVSDEISWGLT